MTLPAAALALLLAEAPAFPVTLEAALALAREHDPALATARLQRGIDLANVDIARERPNPEVRYERTNEAPHDTFGVAQPLELGGRRSRRIAAAEAGLRRGQAELALAEAQAMADTQRSFLALAAAQRKAELAAEIASLTGRARSVAAERESAGDISQFEALQARLAADAADNDAAGARGEIAGARAELNVHIGRAATEPTTAAGDVEGLVLPATLALDASVAVRVLEGRIAEQQARVALAGAERFPDVTVEGSLTHGGNEPDFAWGRHVAAAVVVPLWNRHRGAIRLEEATLAHLRKEREALLAQTEAAVAGATARAAAARAVYVRYRDEILPRSREVEKMAEESYRAGQTGLPTLLLELQNARQLRQAALTAAIESETAWLDAQQAALLGPKP